MIEFKGVRFRYDEEAPEALKGVDLTIPDGIFLVVAGHNGSGKSTLSKHINGLTQEEQVRSPSPGWGVDSLLVRSRQPRPAMEEVPGALSLHSGPPNTHS